MIFNTATVKLDDIETPDILDDYAGLYNLNKSIVGWIKIDGTQVDYPVMQTVDNDYYLTHNYNQDYDKNGSIFMEYNCSTYKNVQEK